MTHTEMKRFVFSQPPTGNQLVDLIQGNKLHHWKVEIEKKHNENMGQYVMGNQYRWEVIFSKLVTE